MILQLVQFAKDLLPEDWNVARGQIPEKRIRTCHAGKRRKGKQMASLHQNVAGCHLGVPQKRRLKSIK